LPLLEYTLAELWRLRQSDGTMTWAAYRELGGVEGALAARADAMLAERYTSNQQAALRQVLLRLVQPGEGAADTRRRVRLDDLVPVGESHDALYALLKPLIDERLLTSGRDSASGEETLEVSHEALIRAWPTLGRWISEARADLRLQLQIEEAAQEWLANDKNPDLLWRGLRLSNATAWLERAQPRLNVRDQAFLDASRAAEQTHKEVEEAARQRELAQAHALAEEQQRRAEEQAASSRRLRRRAIELGVALILAVGAAIAAVFFAVQVRTQLDRSDSLRLANIVQGQAAQADDTTVLLAAEAVARQSSEQSTAALQRAVDWRLRRISSLAGHRGPVWTAAFSPDGQRVLTASADKTARLWDVSGKPLATLEGHTAEVLRAVFSPDGQRVLTASGDSTAQLYVATIDIPALLTMVACRIPRDLTDAELMQYQLTRPLRFQRAQYSCPLLTPLPTNTAAPISTQAPTPLNSPSPTSPTPASHAYPAP
jgi:hypothetical protein